jgi:3-oxo-5-alpha-steroid 4-dehydrogenase 3
MSFQLIAIHNTPCLERRFIPYGISGPEPAEKKRDAHLLDRYLDYLAAIRVPHAWFRHFYIISVVSSLFWGHQILTNGPAYAFVATLAEGGDPESSTPLYRASILWLLIFAQGCRRLYESSAYDKRSKSQMWVGHWVMGIGFYMAVNIALWIDSTSESGPLTLSLSPIYRTRRRRMSRRNVRSRAILTRSRGHKSVAS